jgi:hypothetical protein
LLFSTNTFPDENFDYVNEVHGSHLHGHYKHLTTSFMRRTNKLAIISLLAIFASHLALSPIRLFGAGECTLEQPHITFGSRYGYPSSTDIRWSIVAVSKDGCKKSAVYLQLSDGTRIDPVVKNSYYNAEKNYDAAAFVFEVSRAHKAPSWTLISPGNKLGPFPFPTTDPKKPFSQSKWAIIADMDDSTYSAPTISRLLSLTTQQYDGVIHNGDFAYNIHTSKGKVGDNYFRTFSKVSTLIPFIVTPGNHEYFDNFRFFNYRFQMPGGGNGLETRAANYYSFIQKGIYFVTINWDWVFQEGQNNMPEVLAWLTDQLNQVAKDTNVVYKVFFTHKPFYCTFAEEDCLNFYLFKPVESLLYKHKFDAIVNSHVHLYYRHKKLNKNFQIVTDQAEVPPMFISGHQGVDPEIGGNQMSVKDKRQGRLEAYALAGNPNLLIMEASESGITFTLRDSGSFSKLDELFVSRKVRLAAS